MFLTILGIAFIIIATYFVYKNAQDYGRNATAWALITFFLGFGLQWILPFALMIILTVFWMMTGSTQGQVVASLNDYAFLIGIGSLVLSAVVLLGILKFVSRMPEEPEVNNPPVPPTFN